MTQDILVDLGEEYIIKNNFDGATVSVGLYNDSTDAITDTDDLAEITTEPASTNYARQSTTVSAADLSGDWGVETDNLIEFDFSDVASGDAEAVDVDTGFFVISFQAEDTGDGSSTDHLIGNFALSQTRNTGEFDTLEIAAGDATITLD